MSPPPGDDIFAPSAHRPRSVGTAIAILALIAGLAHAQPSPDALAPADAVEAWMQDRALNEPLAAFLRQRLAESSGEQRRSIADRLGKIYVGMLDNAADAQRRHDVEILCRDLLATVPDADTFELRVNLARATYLNAAETAEKVQLRLATTEERLEAERILRAVAPTLREVAGSINGRVEMLERKEKIDPEDDKIRDGLQEARRIRSLAHYYAGWSEYYLAMLTGDAAMATRAAEDFGALLGAPSHRAAAVDKAPKSLFKYEHIARAAIGSALCASLRGNDIEAMRWMDILDQSEVLPQPVADHLFSTKITILAAAKRWADVELLIRRRKIDPPNIGGGPISVRDARLIAVLALDASKDAANPPRNASVIQELAKNAVSELVAAGELGQVVDLVTRYGSAPIGGTGFAVEYVHGVQAYDQARQAHRQVGEDVDLPSAQSAVCNRYREAAEALKHAAEAPDAARFPRERERAALNGGLALYYAGELEAASEVFSRVATTSIDAGRKQDAAWYAVVALDKAIERGRPSLISARDRMAMVFIREYPNTDRAVQLLLRRGTQSAITDEEAVAVLLGVMPDSPIFESARIEASGLLYKLWLATDAADKQAAGTRLLAIAEEALQAQIRRLTAATLPDATQLDTTKREPALAASISRTARQIAHTALSMPTPEPTRALAALDQLEQIAPTYTIDLKQVRDEINYRRLQAAILLADRSKTTELIAELRKAGGVYASAGERLVYRQLIDAWKSDRSNTQYAQEVVASGQMLADSLFKDSSTLSLAHSVAGDTADAAVSLWKANGDIAMRDIAIRLDRRSWDAGIRSALLCRRLATTAEAAGDLALAAQCWNSLSSALTEGSADWYESRHEAIRILAGADQAAASDAMRQLIALHPDLGPPPWADKLRALAAILGVSLTSEEPIDSSSPAGSGGGR